MDRERNRSLYNGFHMKDDRTYRITVTEVLKRDVSITANSSSEAEELLEEKVRNEEIVLDEGDFNGRYYNTEKEAFVCPTQMEKKILKDNEFLFSVIEVLQKELEINAENEMEAVGKAEELIRSCDVVLSADDYVERILLDYPRAEVETIEEGKTVILYDEDDVTERFMQQYPDGVNINLVRESVANLINMEHLSMETGSDQDFDGLVDERENRLLVQYGNLKAELKLEPQDYSQIYADENTYYSKILSDMDYSSGVNAATVMLNESETLKGQRVLVPVSGRTLDRLFIEGVPYREVMKVIKGMNVRNGEEERLASVLAIHKEKPLSERITKVSVCSGNDGNRFILCHIDGKRMIGERMKKEDAHAIENRADKKMMAARYFEKELLNGRERNFSLKR